MTSILQAWNHSHSHSMLSGWILLLFLISSCLSKELNEVTDQSCPMISEMQSSIIRIMGANYEYGKGIHNLHSMMTNLQNDLSVLKSHIADIQNSQADQYVKSGSLDIISAEEQQSVLDVVHFMSTFMSPHPYNATQLLPYKQWAPDFLSFVVNITRSVRNQDNLYSKLQRNVSRLRKQIGKAIRLWSKLPEKPPSTEQQVHKQDEQRLREGEKVPDRWHHQQDQNNKNVPSRGQHEQKANVAKLQDRITRLEKQLKLVIEDQNNPYKEQDLQGCPSEFVRYASSCYYFSNYSDHWVNAEKHCQHLHPKSHLVAIESKAENDFILTYREYNDALWTSHYIWTGATDTIREGEWTWVGTQKPLYYTNWKPNEPSNHLNEHCIYLRTNGRDTRWDDWHCYAARLNYVCEIIML